MTQTIITNHDGTKGKLVNPFDGNYSPEQYDDFERDNPEYHLVEKALPNVELVGELITQSFIFNEGEDYSTDTELTKGHWSECGNTLYESGLYMHSQSGFKNSQVRQAWQVVSNKEETPTEKELALFEALDNASEQLVQDAHLMGKLYTEAEVRDILKNLRRRIIQCINTGGNETNIAGINIDKYLTK